MKKIHLYGSCAISIQNEFENPNFLEEITDYTNNCLLVVDPDYKEFIPPMQLRRMGKSMRMAVYASQKAIEKAGNPPIDAVITGTGEGCLRDSEKFVEAMWNNEGGMLNPTPFIQSTHNMAAATVALALGCKGYNMTYTNNSNSFESALLDGILYLNEHPAHQILIGGMDEISEKTTNFWKEVGYINTQNPKIPVDLNKETVGEVVSEGCVFFVASTEKKEKCIGTISSVKTKYQIDNPQEFVSQFLQENGLTVSDLDAVILGFNGDSRYDGIYQELSDSFLKTVSQISYKNIYGEFDCVSSLAVHTALKIMENQKIPEILQLNDVKKESYGRILIYNQRRGKNHGLILVENES